MPLRQSLAPDLVPRRLLANAIALNSMAFNSARVVGPALAGVIIAIGTGATGSAVAGVAINLGINTLTYGAVLISLLRMDPRQIRRHEKPEVHPPVLESLREGVSFAARTPLVLWCLVLLGGIAAFGFNFQILLPLFSQEILDLGPEGYGGLYAAMGVGSLAGSLTLAYMSSRRAIPLMLGGGFVFSALLVGIAATQNLLVAAVLVMGAGYFSMLMINTINATVQANTPDALRGRVMSFYVTVFAGSAPLGGLFAGAVAEAWGTPAAFLAGAALSFLTLGVVVLGLRAARRRGELGVTNLDGSATRSRASGAPEARGASAAR
jgi:predicted MFS family arabinose efflux permease